jgi:hypothetical protein
MMGGCLYKGQREATGILTPIFLFEGNLNKVSKFQAAAEHDDARSCTLYYALYNAFFVLLLAPALLGSAN